MKVTERKQMLSLVLKSSVNQQTHRPIGAYRPGRCQARGGEKHVHWEPTSVSEFQESNSSNCSRQSATTKNCLHTSQSFLMLSPFLDIFVDGHEQAKRAESETQALVRNWSGHVSVEWVEKEGVGTASPRSSIFPTGYNALYSLMCPFPWRKFFVREGEVN